MVARYTIVDIAFVVILVSIMLFSGGIFIIEKYQSKSENVSIEIDPYTAMNYALKYHGVEELIYNGRDVYFVRDGHRCDAFSTAFRSYLAIKLMEVDNGGK